jgi:hypothetical protein
VRLGDMVVDNSIAGQLAEMREDVLQAFKAQGANEVRGDE